jgi:tetratricopeptide (TPR) repeat protein
MTQARFHLAELLLQRGDLKTAERLFQTVCAETNAGADTVGQGYGFLGLGITYIMSGDAGRAADNLSAALALAGQTYDMLLRGRVLLASAEFDAARGRYGSALEHLDRALATFTEHGSAEVWQGRVIELASRVRLQFSDTAPADPAA